MSDIAIKMLSDGQGFDIVMDEADLALDDGLYSAIVLSLFTDARAAADDKLPDEDSSDLRGYWADQFSDARGDRFGSRLWLLARSKQLISVINDAERYTSEALDWLVEDGHARSVDVSARVVRSGVLGLQVVIKTVESTVLQYSFEIAQ